MFINTMKNIQNIIKNNDQNNEKKIQDEVMKVIMQNLKLILDTVARIMYNKNYIFKLYNIEKDKKYNIYYFIRDVSYKLYKMKEHNIYNKYAPNSYEYRVFDIYYSNWKQYDEISKKFDDYYNEFMSIRDSFYGDYKEFLGKQKYYRIFSNIGTKLFSECLNYIKYKPREYWDIINTEEDISAMLIFHENCKLIFNTLYDIVENILSEKFKKLNILFSQDELKQYTNKICIEGDKQISIGEILMCLANEIMINMTENVMNKIHRGANILGTISDIGIKYNKEILNDIIKLLSHYCGFLSKSNRKPVKTELKKISKYIEMLNDINEILNNLKMENINDKISLDRDENGNIIENKKLLLSNHALYLEYVDLLHNVKKDKNFTKYVPFIKQLENICFDVKDFFRAYDISEKQKQMKKEDLIVDRTSLNKILNGFITLNIKKITPKQFAYYWNNKILFIFINTIKNIQNIIKNNDQNNEEKIQDEVMKVIMKNLELILDTVVSLVNNKPENGIFYLYNKELEKFDTTTYMTGISRALHEMNKYNIFKKYYNKYATKYHIFDIYYDKWETYDTIREQFMKDYNEFYNEKYENEKENKLFDKQNLCDICETLFLEIINFVKYNPYDKKIDTNVLSDFYKNCKPIFNVIYDIRENILYGKLNEMNMLISQNDLIKYKYTNEIHIGEDEQISLGKILICFANTIVNEVIHVAREIEEENYVYPESNINDYVIIWY